MRFAGAALALALLAAVIPFAGSNAATNQVIQVIEMRNGLKYADDTKGNGAEATAAKKVSVQYTGWLYNNGVKGANRAGSRVLTLCYEGHSVSE